MIAKGEPHWGLAHQDYGWSNGQMGPGGIWVIDLDGVSYDLPIRDLRKIITSTMDDMGTWDLQWIQGVIDAYTQANPIDQEIFELLWIDMAFPNEFYKHVKEVVYDPEVFMNTELDFILQRITDTELNKWEVLSELAKDKAKLYLPGDYTIEETTIDQIIPEDIYDIEIPNFHISQSHSPIRSVPSNYSSPVQQNPLMTESDADKNLDLDKIPSKSLNKGIENKISSPQMKVGKLQNSSNKTKHEVEKHQNSSNKTKHDFPIIPFFYDNNSNQSHDMTIENKKVSPKNTKKQDHDFPKIPFVLSNDYESEDTEVI